MWVRGSAESRTEDTPGKPDRSQSANWSQSAHILTCRSPTDLHLKRKQPSSPGGFYLSAHVHAPPLAPPPTWRQKMFGWTFSRSRRGSRTGLGSVSASFKPPLKVTEAPRVPASVSWTLHLRHLCARLRVESSPGPGGRGCGPAEVSEQREPPSAESSSCSRAEHERREKMDGENSEREREKLPPICSSAVHKTIYSIKYM